ncbi:transmembrane emp24 domain-containing protein 10-like [Sebastes umbrosus]|uniref:transmembrane emp24 domain-containing protein 10-like n=1 Tax=Sebastes umbrosus TaxID=72105 RepID=UPI00189ECA53|nr:transmembrane emp24 domain-containing protein 10-like [Sebastes umbrosus]
MSRLCVFLLIPVILDPVLSIAFNLPVNSRKCLQDNIHKDVLVSGDYIVGEHAKTRIHLKITDSLGDTLYTKENATKGKFSFTTENYDQFDICFDSVSPRGSGKIPEQLIELNMKHGVEAKNYKEIEKVEKLSPLEAQLKHLEHLSLSIADDFTSLRNRVTEMHQTNKSTNTRMKLFSIISVCCFLALATWQIFYLKRFFKTKKLIE